MAGDIQGIQAVFHKKKNIHRAWKKKIRERKIKGNKLLYLKVKSKNFRRQQMLFLYNSLKTKPRIYLRWTHMKIREKDKPMPHRKKKQN